MAATELSKRDATAGEEMRALRSRWQIEVNERGAEAATLLGVQGSREEKMLGVMHGLRTELEVEKYKGRLHEQARGDVEGQISASKAKAHLDAEIRIGQAENAFGTELSVAVSELQSQRSAALQARCAEMKMETEAAKHQGELKARQEAMDQERMLALHEAQNVKMKNEELYRENMRAGGREGADEE